MIESRPLALLRDALIGRRIRNTYFGYMTGDPPSRLSLWHQVRWWYRVYVPAQRRGEKYWWLFYDGGRPIGYGGISYEEGCWWLSAGLIPEARGRGLGEQMFAFITQAALRRGRGEAWLQVYCWNDRAIRLYERLGYVTVRLETQYQYSVYQHPVYQPTWTMVKRVKGEEV